MTYLEHVTAYFVGLVGKGVSLSSRDLSIVRGWETSGVPAPVACRAVRDALRRRGPATARRTALADLEPWIDLPHESTADPQPAPARPPAVDLLLRLAEVGAAADEPLKQAYRAVYREVRRLAEQRLSRAAINRLDEVATAAALDALPETERRSLRRGAMQRAAKLLGVSATDAARARLAPALLEQQLCEKLGLVLPSEIVRGLKAS